MAVLRIANLVLAFFVELGALFAVGAWAWSLDLGSPAKILVAIVGVAGYIGLWAVFAAPKAARRLSSGPRAVFEVLWFGSAAALAAVAGHPTFAIVLLLLAAVNRALLRLWHQQERAQTQP